MTAEERLATYLGDERHIYKGSHALRRRSALADLHDALATARREERERCAALPMPHICGCGCEDDRLSDAYANGWNDYRAAIHALSENEKTEAAVAPDRAVGITDMCEED